MNKKLNLHVPFLLGIFLIGIFSANVLQGQTNAFWDVNGVSDGTGGTGTFSSSGVFWTTNSVNATANGGGPIGGGTFAVANGAANSTGTYTTNGATWKSNSGAYTFNFGGTAGTVTQGGDYRAYGVNFLTSGYIWNIDGSGANARTITTTNGVNLGANALTLANGARGLNSFTFAGPTTATAVGITGTSGSTLTLRNLVADSATNSFGVYLSGGTISSNIAINVDIGAGSKISLGSQSSAGATINSAITLNTNASGVALNITNSSSGTVALNGVISGANGLVLNSSGTGSGTKIQLGAANTYSGGTTLNNSGTGIFTISNSAAFGTGMITSAGSGLTNYVRAEVADLNIANSWQIDSGSILRLGAANNGWTVTASGQIAGAGSFLLSNSGINASLTGTNNSFGGGVQVANGTVYFTKMGTAGQNSSLGTNGTITVGAPLATTTGALRWNGTTNETSDKTIVLSGTTGGLGLYAQGAAGSTLTIDGSINSTGVGNKTLNIAGLNSSTLVINGVINENGGTNNVVIGSSQSGTVFLNNMNNSFSGAITISNSAGSTTTVLSVANIGNSNANSALGRNGTINFNGKQSSSLTTLKYTGTGETSDKVINLASTEGGAILEQAGTNGGNLKFTSAITATGVGAKSITLKGATAATGELAGNIADGAGGAISLVKNGSGTWILSGSNSYTGSTTVENKDGVLKLMGANALSTKTSLLGSSSVSNIATVNFGLAGDYTANSFGNSVDQGNNIAFTNSSGGVVNLTFTNGNNVLTASAGSSGGKTLLNQSANLNIVFDGNMDIGSTNYAVAPGQLHEIGGSGNWLFKGNLTNGAGIRGLEKNGTGTLELRGTGNSFTGNTEVDEGTLNVSGSLTGSTNLIVSTIGTATNASRGTATLNVASGASLLSGSTTTVYSGGNLIVNGTGTAGTVVLERNGLLGGSGTVGAVTLKDGAFLNPGNSPGLLTALSATWEAGSTYTWEINSNATTAEAGTNWDLFSVTGTLDMSALSSSTTMNLVLASLSGFDLTSSLNRTWVIAQAGSLLGTGGAALSTGDNVSDYFNINATAFNAETPSLVTGWKIEVGETTVSGSTLKTLQMIAIPEPSTGSLLGFGLAGLVVTRLLRRKQS